MSTAVAEIPANSPLASAGAAPGLQQRFAALDRSARWRLGAAAALLLAGVVAAVFYSSRPNYRVLFSNLNDRDGGAIVAQLAQMNVPYKYTEGGGAIMVPGARVHDVRLKLASQGLPKGSVSGFELTENSRFGVTQFQERLNFQRGLEGELTRSIQALESVQSARVHLALPQQNGFFREQQKPSASVLVSLYPGRFLDRAQLAGIVHLVSSSVPDMAPTAVSVVDDTGKLLSKLPDGADDGVDAQQLAYVQQLEQLYTRRILEILEPVVGRHNVKAQVTAEVDFSRTESTSEEHRPNLQLDASAVRSQQVLESNIPPAPVMAGVPGAVSNQPPQGSSAPVNGAPGALGVGMGNQGGGGALGNNAKREVLTNYEVDRTTRVTRGGGGAIRRVNAAVVVNYQPMVEEPGKPPVNKALTPEQLEQMTALVRETIGFNKERGDSVNLMNTPFLVDEAAEQEVPLWKQPEVLELSKSLGWPLAVAVAVAMLFLGLLRPVIKAGNQPAGGVVFAGGQLDALESEALERPALPPPGPTSEELRLQEARELAKTNPIAVANIVKTWVNGE